MKTQSKTAKEMRSLLKEFLMMFEERTMQEMVFRIKPQRPIAG